MWSIILWNQSQLVRHSERSWSSHFVGRRNSHLQWEYQRKQRIDFQRHKSWWIKPWNVSQYLSQTISQFDWKIHNCCQLFLRWRSCGWKHQNQSGNRNTINPHPFVGPNWSGRINWTALHHWNFNNWWGWKQTIEFHIHRMATIMWQCKNLLIMGKLIQCRSHNHWAFRQESELLQPLRRGWQFHFKFEPKLRP